MAQTYSTIPEDERLDRSCSIDVDVIDKKTGRRAIIALAALAFDGPSDWRIGMVGSLRRRRGVR